MVGIMTIEEELRTKIRQLEVLADYFEAISKKEPDKRLFKTAQRDCRVAHNAYGHCAKRIRKILDD
jgi:hypothetical protein